MRHAASIRPLVMLAAVVLGGCAAPLPGRPGPGSAGAAVEANHSAPLNPLPLTSEPAPSFGLPNFGQAVERVRNSVVGISAVRIVSVDTDDSHAGEDPGALAESMREHGMPLAQSKPPRVALRDRGCGIVVTRDGYILTAAHVVDGATVVTVQLRDGRDLAGRVVGADLSSDVAVLKVDAAGLIAATLGRSGDLKPGTWVAAIGSPFGLEGSVAVGVVSAIDRTLPGDDSFAPFIQTDLPLNPGNSGGPLLDAQGEVVGINSQIALGESGEAGVSFAIPIEIARSVEAELIRTGRVERGDLGMAFQDMDIGLARAFGRSTAAGALVHTIRPGGAALRAHLRTGDIIVELDGRQVGGASQLANTIASHRPGSTVVLGIWRAHRFVRVPVLIEAAETPAVEATRATGSAAEGTTHVLSVRELAPKERRVLETSGRLLVTGVSAQAAAAGIEVGDIVLGTADASLRSAGEFSRALAESTGVLVLLIEHHGLRTFVAVPLECCYAAEQQRAAN